MDEPEHSLQRSAVNPVVGSRNLPNFAELIRSRTEEVLDSLPVGETFNWVDEVSIELTYVVPGASWTTIARPVRSTDATSVSSSIGLSERRSMTSSDHPSSRATRAASRQVATVGP